MSSILLTGAGGQLGKAFLHHLRFDAGYHVYAFDHQQLDLTNEELVRGVLSAIPRVKFWINCAAYTQVDKAETNEALAYNINADACEWMAESCAEHKVHLIHFSSDYVYDNGLTHPMKETDPTHPRGVYAKSKLEGEKKIMATDADYTIIRTSWVYGPWGNNFVRTMLRLGSERNELNIVSDQVGAPTFTFDIVEAIKYLIDEFAANPSMLHGVYNFANQGAVSWADFARTIFRNKGIECQVNDISTEQYNAPSPRPAFSVLDCSKIQAYLPFPIAHWEDGLERYLEDFPSGS